MQRWNWSGLAVVAALLAPAPAWAAGATDYFAETQKDFGTSPRGPVLTHYFTVKNTSTQTITLGQPRVSCGCVSAYALKSQLAPGETGSVVAYMNTRLIQVAGTLKTVIVYVPVHTGTAFEEVQLRVQSIARDDLVLSNETLAFGNVRKGQGGTASTRVTFYADANWQVSEALSTGIYVKPTVKKVETPGVAGVTYEVTAALDPACPVGNWTASVALKTSSAGVINVPVTVNVSAPIEVKPDAAKFAAVVAGKPSELKLLLQGDRAFKVLEVKGLGAELEITPAGPAARPVHVLTLTLKAKAAGEFKGQLEIVTDHPDQPKLTVAVTATATAAKGE